MKKYIPVTMLAVLLILVAGGISFIVVPNGDNLISGKVITQVYIYETPPEGCAVNLTSGTNMVSFYCVTGDSFITDALVNRDNQTLNFTAIYKFNAGSTTDSWDSYNPSLPSWADQSLTNLNRRYGYVVQMSDDGEFFKEGYRFSSSDINLKEGWNFIGYPSDNEVNITQALTALSGRYTRVETYTPVNGTKTWLLHTPPANGDLNYMTPMVGYWIYMNATAVYIVNW